MRRGIVILALAGLAQTATATNWYIRVDGNEANDGLSWATAKTNLQALAQSKPIASVDTINVGEGTYVMTNGHLAARQNTRFIASNQSENATILTSGTGTNRVLYFGNGVTNCQLIGFTVIGGNEPGTGNGGGVYWYPSAGTRSSCYMSNCWVVSNSAYDGGGVYGGPAFNTWFSFNGARRYGGGQASSTAASIGCTYVSNRADCGGAVYNAALYGCQLGYNYATNYGGGQYKGFSTNSVYSYNVAFRGGGVFDCDGVFYGFFGTNSSTDAVSTGGGGGGETGSFCYSCVFVGNTAPLAPAAWVSDEQVWGCTFLGHTNAAAVLYNYNPAGSVANNLYYNNASNPAHDVTVTNWQSNVVCSVSPFLGDGTVKIKSTASEVIGLANPLYTLGALDFYGRPRTNGAVDVGAVEYTAGDDAVAATEPVINVIPVLLQIAGY